jgi:hypothetical protein
VKGFQLIHDLKQSGFYSLAFAQTLKLLHIRRAHREPEPARAETSPAPFPMTESEVYQFAEWAFGPHGFPKLQIVAYGDFSHENRHASKNTLLCRRAPSPELEHVRYQAILYRDWHRMKVDDGYLEVLGACPVDYLLWPY